MTATNKCYNFVGFRCRVPLRLVLLMCTNCSGYVWCVGIMYLKAGIIDGH